MTTRTDLEPALDKLFGELFPTIARMPAKGIVHTWNPMMARPACPWTFGTVIGPTSGNDDSPAWTRHMIVGLHRNEDAVVAMDLRAGEPSDATYIHLLGNITERWEPVSAPES